MPRLIALCLMKDNVDVDTQVWEVVAWRYTVDGLGRLKVLLTEKIIGWIRMVTRRDSNLFSSSGKRTKNKSVFA